MKQFIAILFISLSALVFASCKETTTEPASSTYNADISLTTSHLRPPRIGESYVLWLRSGIDSPWVNTSIIKVTYISVADTSAFLFHNLTSRIDSISDAMITIENTPTATTPGLVLMSGKLSGDSTIKTSNLSASPLGDFSGLGGSLVFTTQLSDTTAYKHEFYLSSYDGATFRSSLSQLPLAPTGWKYGLWAVDSNFTPDQLIFYGLFSDSVGHDSDSANDNLPFPGGDKLQPMNIPTGSIIVSLEPDFYGNDVKLKGPSPFPLLSFQRSKYIQRNVNYPMTNVSGTGIPSAIIRIIKK